MTLPTHLSTTFEDIVLFWQQGGVLDRIQSPVWGFSSLVTLVVLVLVDSEVSRLSDNDLERGCSCEEAGSGPDSGEHSERCAVAGAEKAALPSSPSLSIPQHFEAVW